ncbi:hypothetical protein RHGRI_029825 [Rhododendron griersonianum]|uniref:Enoyl reductase (ER) domain-containing protein n=1 Tax=Rhododendron griersonianum TaxID=479676 RepID=A0AAV6IKT2_9ERIC|nr:hypothetical protein RHGRI_029825 [Rhododendron griersonianum]
MSMQVVPGCDMAGVVMEKGSGVTKFDIDDEVYANIQDSSSEDGRLKQLGTQAEYIVVEENLVAKKPENISFEEAASLPLAVQTAMEGCKTGGFKEGQTIFEVGGAGGVGTLAVQLAKHFYEASLVVATTSTAKVEFVRSLGAGKVVDYTKTRYEEVEDKFDLLYDTIGYIAMYATLASRDVDCCLIPESPFYLKGPGGLIDYIEKRLEENGHMVIVIAEGGFSSYKSSLLFTATILEFHAIRFMWLLGHQMLAGNIVTLPLPYEIIAIATHRGIAIWHLGFNPKIDGKLSTEKVTSLSLVINAGFGVLCLQVEDGDSDPLILA